MLSPEKILAYPVGRLFFGVVLTAIIWKPFWKKLGSNAPMSEVKQLVWAVYELLVNNKSDSEYQRDILQVGALEEKSLR